VSPIFDKQKEKQQRQWHTYVNLRTLEKATHPAFVRSKRPREGCFSALKQHVTHLNHLLVHLHSEDDAVEQHYLD